MRIFYPPNHTQHVPPAEIFNGQRDMHQEVPGRLETILSAVTEAGFQPEEMTTPIPVEVLSGIHTQQYLDFLEGTSRDFTQDYRYPSVFQYRTGQPSTNPLAQQGRFSFDLYTPLSASTWQAALDSASAAYQAATTVLSGESHLAYALGRPPGHHAEPDQMGGYCYLNNAAVAAQYFSQHGRVVCIDIDFHHGNGTQAIFYDRADVQTISLHADPNWKFPFFSGFANEVGQGEGRGYNHNFPLAQGTTDEQYQVAFAQALKILRDFSPDFVVISLGLDIHESDPIGGFAITTEYIGELGRQFGSLELPTVIIQEGGYNTKLLGSNVVAFLNGISQ